MGETADPRASLKDKDVSTRAAAARDLARIGDLDDAMALVDLAKRDKSPSVRLYTAAGAADIALRHAGRIPPDRATALVQAVTSADPGDNPSLLMVLAALPTDDVVKRLGRTLRDPRYDVRAGAATALRRMAMSASHLGADGADRTVPARLEAAFEAWLAEGRHPADATLELVRISGQAGLSGLDSALQQVSRRAPAHAEAADLALRRLRERHQAETWQGLWVSFGADALEPVPEDGGAVGWVAVADATLLEPDSQRALLLSDDGGARAGELGVRMVWAPRGEEPAVAALQVRDQAYWRLEGKDLLAALQALSDSVGGSAGAAGCAASGLEEVEGIAAKRMRARLLWRAERPDEALRLLAELTEGKKPKGEDLYVLAHVKHALGQPEEARRAVTAAIAAAPKKCPWLDDANALLGSLSS